MTQYAFFPVRELPGVLSNRTSAAGKGGQGRGAKLPQRSRGEPGIRPGRGSQGAGPGTREAVSGLNSKRNGTSTRGEGRSPIRAQTHSGLPKSVGSERRALPSYKK